MKAPSENGVVRALQLACVALIVAMALNAPSPNGEGGWRDQFVEGWRQAQADDGDDQAPVEGDRSVAGASTDTGEGGR